MSTIIMFLLVAMYSALLASAPRKAIRVEHQEILTYSSLWKSLTRVLWLFPAGIALAAIISPPDPDEAWIAVALIVGFGILMLVMTLEVFKREIALDSAGISQKSAWSSPVKIAWKDVREVAWSEVNGIIVRPARGREVRASAFLSGLETLAQTLERRLPQVPTVPGVVKKIRAHRV